MSIYTFGDTTLDVQFCHMTQTSSFVCRWTVAVTSYYTQCCSGLRDTTLAYLVYSAILNRYQNIIVYLYANDTPYSSLSVVLFLQKKNFNMCSHGPTLTSFKLILPKLKNLYLGVHLQGRCHDFKSGGDKFCERSELFPNYAPPLRFGSKSGGSCPPAPIGAPPMSICTSFHRTTIPAPVVCWTTHNYKTSRSLILYISTPFSAAAHVEHILSVANQRMYLLA